MKEYRATKDNPFHFSAGGIIYKQTANGTQILLLHRKKSKIWPYNSWHLPKGTIIEGETPKQTVERECLEETGYLVKVLNKIGELKSIYQIENGVIAQKTTTYFACEPIKKITNKIQEHDEVVWIDIRKAKILLSGFNLWEKEEKIVEKFEKRSKKL